MFNHALAFVLFLLPFWCRCQERLYNFDWLRDKNLIHGNTVKRILSDRDGIIWLATDKGLCRFDPIQSTHFVHDYRNPNSISSDNLSGLCEDRAGNTWITTYTGGLSFHDKRLPQHESFVSYRHYVVDGDTVSIPSLSDAAEDRKGNLWFGGQDTDLLRMDARTREIERIKLVADSCGPVSIYTLYCASDGTLWIGTRHHGFFSLDPLTGARTAYNLKPSSKPWQEENGCGAFAEQDGYLWFSYYDFNLCRLELATGRIETNLLKLGPNRRVYDNSINALAVKDSVVFAGHATRGLYRYHMRSGVCERIDWHTLTPQDPQSDQIMALHVGNLGALWIGTQRKGLIRYADHHNRFSTFFRMKPTAPIHHMSVEQGQWWCRGSEGFSIFDPKRQQAVAHGDYGGLWVSNFTRIAGQIYLSTYDRGIWVQGYGNGWIQLPIRGNDRGLRRADCGEVLATDSGFVVGHADRVFAKHPLSRAVVNSFSIHDREVSHMLRQPLIELSHQENFFTFGFSSAGMFDPQQIQFSYMLEGVDKQWRTANGHYTVSYTDIGRGNYRFRVRIGDPMGNWSASITEVPLLVNGPFWQSPWFLVALAATLSLAIYGIFRYRLSLYEAFNEDLKRQLAAKTEEVKAQVRLIEAKHQEKLKADYQKRLSESELKAIRAQMNPHFMFNVLNSIESYVLENDAKSAGFVVNRFAHLARLILENSSSSTVSVFREWQTLQLYVQLEAMRFDDGFDYSFTVEGDWDITKDHIPPMLVQPLVENSIHHGIRQNPGTRGVLCVSVSRTPQCVRFVITDNGVGLNGRKKPAKPVYKQASMGISTIRERLKLLNGNNACRPGSLELVELAEKGLKGTQATLCIPLPAVGTGLSVQKSTPSNDGP